MGYATYQARGLDASSKAYIDENLPAITTTWSKEELLKRSSPQLLTIINEKPEQIDKLFEKLSKLGTMRSVDVAKGDANVSYTNTDGKVTTASYIAKAKFENGEARIAVRLVQVSGQWQISLFKVTVAASQDAPTVELYITSWCPYCKKAMNFFRSRGIPFVAYDIEKDADAARRKRQLASQRGVPFAVINGKRIHGYSEAGYLRALDLK